MSELLLCPDVSLETRPSFGSKVVAATAFKSSPREGASWLVLELDIKKIILFVGGIAATL